MGVTYRAVDSVLRHGVALKVIDAGAIFEGSVTLAELRARWQWDPLRGNPRFQKILAGPEPRIVYP